MNCKYDYEGDQFLNANLSTIDDFICWVEDEQFFGARMEFNKENFACSAFTAACSNGDRLFGRNFDYSETDTLVFYTAPSNGYASYAVTDMRFFDIGKGCQYAPESLLAKAILTAAPYASMDGINEKGVGVGVLDLPTEELHQDSGKPDLLIFAAIRGILDNCASIDEAIALLSKYDMHSYLLSTPHLFITDRSGRSVVVEWSGNETLIVEDNAVTNSVLSPEHPAYDPDWQCDRYDSIKQELSAHQNVFSSEAAMQVLYKASAGSNSRGTQWSCIYDLDAFTLDICLDRDYDHTFCFADGKPVQ
jgi:penicillin V acylase-like amidase (Ntn superfamily)